jgi:hypothetical protein
VRFGTRLVALGALSLLAACSEPSTPVAAPPTFITNGTPTGEDFGSVGALLFDFNKDGVLNGDDQFCTGSLIAPTIFLTAAHCVAGAPRGTQLHVSFAPDLNAGSIRTIAATGFTWDPAFGHDASDPHDLAVVFLPARATRGMQIYALPPAGYLDRLAAQGGLVDAIFVNVGYGTANTTTGIPEFPHDGLRSMSESEFMALQPAWLGLLMNTDATELGGDCFGDSGGPKFRKGHLNLIVATVTKGDPVCRASSWDYRVDTPNARAFLGQFVALP